MINKIKEELKQINKKDLDQILANSQDNTWGHGKDLMPYNKDSLVNLINSELKRKQKEFTMVEEERMNSEFNRMVE
jgi:hypothetical protein